MREKPTVGPKIGDQVVDRDGRTSYVITAIGKGMAGVTLRRLSRKAKGKSARRAEKKARRANREEYERLTRETLKLEKETE